MARHNTLHAHPLLGCVFAFCLLFLGACSATDSDNVTTQGIGADIRIEANGDGNSSVEAHLYVGSGGLFNTDLELENGDRLIATAALVTKVLNEERGLLGGFTYTTTFGFDTPGIEYLVAFDRAVGTDALDSHVTLPQAVSFLQPDANQMFNSGDLVQISWDNVLPNRSLGLVYTTRCPVPGGSSVYSGSRSIPDSGSYSISTATLLGQAALNTPPGESCTTDLDLSRTNIGQLDPNFGEGGSITAKQVRTRRISIIP